MNKNVLLLLSATAIWGFAFIAARWALDFYDPFWVNAFRFILAGVLSLPFLIYKKSFSRQNNILKETLFTSLLLFGILIFQTIGLKTTTVAKSGFITTLYTLMIPIIGMIFFHKKFKSSFWFLILMALIGVAMMCNFEIHNLTIGDFFTFLCAICGALHIIFVGQFARKIDSAIEFNFLQNFFTGIIATAAAFVFSDIPSLAPLFNYQNNLALMGILFLGIISSMISFTAQVIAQKNIPDHFAGLIFLMESPFAALFGFLVLGETLSLFNLFGAGLIVISIVLVPKVAGVKS